MITRATFLVQKPIRGIGTLTDQDMNEIRNAIRHHSRNPVQKVTFEHGNIRVSRDCGATDVIQGTICKIVFDGNVWPCTVERILRKTQLPAIMHCSVTVSHHMLQAVGA